MAWIPAVQQIKVIEYDFLEFKTDLQLGKEPRCFITEQPEYQKLHYAQINFFFATQSSISHCKDYLVRKSSSFADIKEEFWEISHIDLFENSSMRPSNKDIFEYITILFEKANKLFDIQYLSHSPALDPNRDYFNASQIQRITNNGRLLKHAHSRRKLVSSKNI